MQHPELLVVTDELRSIDGTLFDPGPVTDWATDFDHTDPGWAGDPYPIWDDLRQRCPVAHSDRYGGVWLPTRYEDVAEIAQDPGLFSSRAVIVSNRKPPPGLAPIGAIPPISSDPPYHQGARKLLQPAFSPGSVGAYEESTQAFCHELIDGFGDRSVIDAATEYAQHIPMRVIGDMLGLPRTDGQAFARFVHNALEGVNSPIEDRIAGFEELFAYLRTQVEDHLAHPRPDLTSFLIETHTDDGRTDLLRVAGSIALLLIAGIDTTWSAIGASLWHLAGHPDDRRRLVDDPALVIPATEELLRVYAPVTMARPGGVRPARRRRPRPSQQPPRRLRHRCPPVPGRPPGPHGAPGCARHLAQPHPRFLAQRPRCRPVVRRPDPRTANPADHAGLIPGGVCACRAKDPLRSRRPGRLMFRRWAACAMGVRGRPRHCRRRGAPRRASSPKRSCRGRRI
jgi:hypothetical protein